MELPHPDKSGSASGEARMYPGAQTVSSGIILHLLSLLSSGLASILGDPLATMKPSSSEPVTPAKKKKRERTRLSQHFQTCFQTLTHWHTWSLVHPRTNCRGQGDGQLWLVSPGPSSGAGRWHHSHRTTWRKSGGRMASRENGCVVTKRKRDGFRMDHCLLTCYQTSQKHSHCVGVAESFLRETVEPSPDSAAPSHWCGWKDVPAQGWPLSSTDKPQTSFCYLPPLSVSPLRFPSSY